MITGLLNAIKDLFNVLNKALIKEPRNFMIIFLTAISTYLLVENQSHINSPINTAPQDLGVAIQLNGELPLVLEEIRVKAGADRVLLRQFHNGTHSISGVPFLFVATTHSSAAPGQTISGADAWQSYPLSTILNTIELMTQNGVYNPNCVSLLTSEVTDDFYQDYLNRYDTKRILLCPIVNSDNLLIGYISVHYTDEESLSISDEEMESRLEHLRSGTINVVSLLRTIREEPPKWWQFWL